MNSEKKREFRTYDTKKEGKRCERFYITGNFYCHNRIWSIFILFLHIRKDDQKIKVQMTFLTYKEYESPSLFLTE